MVLTYYDPHCSGLTIYVQRLSEALVARGHEVTVLTSRHAPDLPEEEVLNGVRVVRSPVALHLHKGVIMPRFPLDAWRLLRQHDVVNLHLPLIESALVAGLARHVVRRPVVLTYHCDLRLPWSVLSRFILAVMNTVHHLAGRWAHLVVTYTRDYAEHSPFVSRYLSKVGTVYPPIVMPSPSTEVTEALRRQWGLEGCRVVGFAGRFAAEKGVEHLLDTIPEVAERYPSVRYVFAGEYERVLGENHYQRLQPAIQRFRDRLVFLGVLRGEQLAAFYALCDVLVLPSTNSTESFGLVQVEAMSCGTPVVASDLPGVREAVRVTGMGEVAPVADSRGLAAAILRVLDRREGYVRPRSAILQRFDLERTVSTYEAWYADLLGAARAGVEVDARRPGASGSP